MTHGSLFSGIGGFDLAAEWMGWQNIFHCEWNDFGKRVLSYYWPKAISYHDITKTDFTIHRGTIDILTGGFPCQPYSNAGKRLGKADDRHLWPEMLRTIREIQPRWVVGENVLGLVNWNGGLVFHEVQADLEAEGYEVQPYVLPAAGVNAPHRRDRVWFVAYRKANRFTSTKGTDKWQEHQQNYGSAVWPTSNTDGISRPTTDTDGAKPEHNTGANQGKTGEVWRETQGDVPGELRSDGITTHTDNTRAKHTLRNNENREEGNQGWQKQPQPKSWQDGNNATDTGRQQLQGSIQPRSVGEEREVKRESGQPLRPVCGQWEQFPTQPPICNGNDGISSRLDSITFSKWRNESIKAGGNAIVPQVALQIFRTIEAYENLNR